MSDSLHDSVNLATVFDKCPNFMRKVDSFDVDYGVNCSGISSKLVHVHCHASMCLSIKLKHYCELANQLSSYHIVTI